jgi:hypothetical protein
VRVGAPGPPDESDVVIGFRLTNVTRHADGAEYTGNLRTELTMRLTDKQHGVSSTTEDFPLVLDVQCVATPSLPDEKGRCETTTTLDALTLGGAAERSRAVWELRQVAVYDPSEFPGRNLVAVPGLFVP